MDSLCVATAKTVGGDAVANAGYHDSYWLHIPIDERAALGFVVPGENFVAAMTFDHPSGANTRLVILASTGVEHAAIENRVRFMGRERVGDWDWFEPAINPRTDVFGAVLTTLFDGDFFGDVDARSGRVLTARRTR